MRARCRLPRQPPIMGLRRSGRALRLDRLEPTRSRSRCSERDPGRVSRRTSMEFSQSETLARNFLTDEQSISIDTKSGGHRFMDQGSELEHLTYSLRIRRLGVRVPSGARHHRASDLRKCGSGALQDSSTVDSRCSWGARLFRSCLCRDCRRRAGARRSVWILAKTRRWFGAVDQHPAGVGSVARGGLGEPGRLSVLRRPHQLVRARERV